jgi:hypothetical protein
MIELFFRFTVKGTNSELINYFATCRGGPLYGPADSHRILYIRELVLHQGNWFYIKSFPASKIVAFK